MLYRLLRGHERARGREAARCCCSSLQLVSLQSDVALLQDPLKSMLCLSLTLVAGPMPDGEDDLEKLHACRRCMGCFGLACKVKTHTVLRPATRSLCRSKVSKNNTQELPSSPARSERG